MNISVTDALPLFTNKIIAKYSDHQKPKSFGRSYFTEVDTDSKLASIMSQRGLNLVASDISRGSRGNLNVFDKYSEGIVYPPYFSEFFNLVDLGSYDTLEATGFTSQIAWGQFLDETGAKMQWLMDKIDRRYELQCWQLFNTGIVTLSNGANISYGRQAASLFDPGAGNYWANAGINPLTGTLARGANYLNTVGKMSGNTIDVIFSTGAWSAWLANTAVGANDLKFNNNLTSLANTAVRDSTGKTFLGSTTNEAFNYNFFAYSDFYQDQDGTVHKYLDDKKVIMVPSQTSNVLVYTAVPQDFTKGMGPRKGKWQTWNDVKRTAMYQGIDSAGVPILGAVDQVYTEKVVA